MTTCVSNRKTIQYRKPVWADIAGRFPGDRDCLAAFLAFEAAEVLAGMKPSTLINLPDRPRRCGKNLYLIWKEHGEGILMESSLEVAVLANRPGSLLLLLYDRAALGRLLSKKGVLAILRRVGYPEESGVDTLLSEFGSRFASGGVPHEIGIALGYPLKDVVGFMGLGHLTSCCQGPWRIYGNPIKSLDLAERHRQCRRRMALRLMAGSGPYECLGSPAGSAGRKQGLFLTGK
jgi:hypothetical protein